MIYKTRTSRNYYGTVIPDGKWSSSIYYDNLGASDSAFLTWQASLLAHPSWYLDRSFWTAGLTFSQKFGSTNRGFGRFNDCENYKSYVWSLPFSARYYGPSGNVVGLYRLMLPSDIYTRLQSVSAKKPLPSMDSLIQIARMRATCNLVPAFEPYVEMLNFLFELKDFKDVVKAAPSVLGRTHKVLLEVKDKTAGYKGGRPVIPRGGVPTTEPTGPAAGAWLTWQLTVQPFIRDTAEIIAGLSSCATEAYSKYKNDGLEPSTMHYREVVHEQVLASQEWSSYPTLGIATCDTREYVVFNATLQQMYRAPDKVNSEIQREAWGLRFTPEVIWNGIPFTFVLDYGLKVGKALKQAYRYQNRPDMIPIQYCESVLRENATGFFVKGSTVKKIDIGCIGKITSNPNGKPLTVVRRSEYIRSLAQQAYCMPLPKFKVPSGTQGLNMLALARVFL